MLTFRGAPSTACSKSSPAILATVMQLSKVLILTLIAAALGASPASAAEWNHAGVAGMAGAGTANPYDNSAAFNAPATVALVPLYTSQVDVGLDNTLAEGWWGTTTVRDSQSSYTSATLSYTRTDSSPIPLTSELPGWVTPGETLDNDTTEHDIRLSVGYAMIGRRLAIGGSMLWQRRLSELSGNSNLFEADLSIAGMPITNLVLAGTLHDVSPGDGRPLSAEIGAWWRPLDPLSFAIDGVWTGDAFGTRAGVEWVALGVASLRAGYSHLFGAEREGVVGLGIGVVSEQARLDYGLQWTVVGLEQHHLVHTLGTTVAF